MMKLSPIQKITLAGMFLVLTILGTRIPALFSIPSATFIRISFGPSLIIFSSIVLGPLYGVVIGAASDLLGGILFPTTLSSMSINPFITLMYALVGVLPWCIVWLTKYVRKIFNKPVIIGVLLFGFWGVLLWFSLTHDSFSLYGGKVYNLSTPFKVIMLCLTFAFSVFTMALLHMNNKLYKAKLKEYGDLPTPYEISFVCFIVEIVIMLIMGSIVKSIMYEIDFIFIFVVQVMMIFIDVPLNTFIVTYLLLLMKKIRLSRQSVESK